MIKEMQLLIFTITHIQVGISILQIRYVHNSIMDIHNYRVCSLWLYCTYRLNNRADHLDGCHTDQLSNVTMLKVTKELCHVSTTKSALAFFTQWSCPTGKINWDVSTWKGSSCSCRIELQLSNLLTGVPRKSRRWRHCHHNLHAWD